MFGGRSLGMTLIGFLLLCFLDETICKNVSMLKGDRKTFARQLNIYKNSLHIKENLRLETQVYYYY
jgi:hypothetical protein